MTQVRILSGLFQAFISVSSKKEEIRMTDIDVIRPRTREGYPLPTIKEWNRFATQAEEEMTKRTESDARTSVFKGAVDDLGNGNCGYCNDEMIRQLEWYIGPFNAGIVYCHGVQKDREHPLEFWFELWPYAGTKRLSLMRGDKEEEIEEATFGLSNPIIEKCYTTTAIDWHQHVGLVEDEDSIGLAYSPGGRTTSLPKPNYTHK